MIRRSLFFLLPVLFLIACQVSEESRIRKMLDRREEALGKKDLSLYLSCISKDYQDKTEDIGQLQRRIEGYFKGFDRIDYAHWDRIIHIEGETASVIQQFDLEVEKGGKKSRYSGKEALYLKKEGRHWKIIRGL